MHTSSFDKNKKQMKANVKGMRTEDEGQVDRKSSSRDQQMLPTREGSLPQRAGTRRSA